MAIRSRAIPVERALADPRTPGPVRALLERAASVRAFAESRIGLRQTRNFSSIVELEADHLASVVSACAELGFTRHLWTYPLVGALPYRGYFDQKEADKEAARLKKLGLDVIVRPVDAFSSLGWLSDPLFSFMASYGEEDIAELVIHEMTHATVFLKGSGGGAEQFNEELATFVGREGALEWIASVHGEASSELASARADLKDAEAFSAWLRGTASQLASVYSGPLSDGEKRERKAAVLRDRAAEYRDRYPELFQSDRYRDFPMERLNNAYLDLYRLYEGEPALYRDFYEKVCGSDLRRFMAEIGSLVAKTRGGDPKALMRAAID